jgi:hypothetical protein
VSQYDRRPRWKGAVFRAATLPATTKLVLLAMYDHMDRFGKVRYPVRDLAADLGYKNPRRVSDRITDAHRHGFLVTVHKAVHGRVAEYQATFPSDLETGSLGRGSEVPANGVTGNGVTRREDARNGVTSIEAQTPEGTDRSVATDEFVAASSLPAPLPNEGSNEEQDSTTCPTYRKAS